MPNIKTIDKLFVFCNFVIILNWIITKAKYAIGIIGTLPLFLILQPYSLQPFFRLIFSPFSTIVKDCILNCFEGIVLCLRF